MGSGAKPPLPYSRCRKRLNRVKDSKAPDSLSLSSAPESFQSPAEMEEATDYVPKHSEN